MSSHGDCRGIGLATPMRAGGFNASIHDPEERRPSRVATASVARTIHEPRSPDGRSAAHPCVAPRSLVTYQLPRRSFGCLRLGRRARSARELSGLALALL